MGVRVSEEVLDLDMFLSLTLALRVFYFFKKNPFFFSFFYWIEVHRSFISFA